MIDYEETKSQPISPAIGTSVRKYMITQINVYFV